MAGRYKIDDQTLAEAVRTSFSVYEVLRKIGVRSLSGGNHYHFSNRIRKLRLSTAHFTGQGHNKGKILKRRKPEEILVLRSDGKRTKTNMLKRSLVDIGVEYKCGECGNDGNHNGKSLVLQVDHKNGNWMDDRVDNLRFLCPNCHSQTETFGSKSKVFKASVAERQTPCT